MTFPFSSARRRRPFAVPRGGLAGFSEDIAWTHLPLHAAGYKALDELKETEGATSQIARRLRKLVFANLNLPISQMNKNFSFGNQYDDITDASFHEEIAQHHARVVYRYVSPTFIIELLAVDL